MESVLPSASSANNAAKCNSTLPASETSKYKEIIASLPKLDVPELDEQFRNYQGFWFAEPFLEGLLPAQDHFKPQPADIFLCSFPKTGTTWLKALGVAIVRRKLISFDDPSNPLLTKFPHKIVPFLEIDLWPTPTLERDPELPILASHVAYECLPKSIIDSDCKTIYLCRNPKDTLISFWQFTVKMKEEVLKVSLEDFVDQFCKGVAHYGPYWEHVLGYWKASLERPDKILFVKYEDLKKDTVSQIKKMAEFMGYPFSLEEEKEGVIEKVVEVCSFDSMKNLDVNKDGNYQTRILKLDKKSFFRKGETGDWKNYLTPEMTQRLDQIAKEKFGNHGLSFD